MRNKHPLPLLTTLTTTLLFTAGCSKAPDQAMPLIVSEEEKDLPSPSKQEAPEWAEVHCRLASLPLYTLNKLDASFFAQMEAVSRLPKNGGAFRNDLLRQLKEKNDVLPIFSGYSIPLKYQSQYDKATLRYTLQAPRQVGEETPLIIVLGSQTAFPHDLKDINAWKCYIPSRPQMNYQLIAEGDLWAILGEIEELYPQVKQAKHFLVGVDFAADAALLLANNYPGYFDGVAFSGGSAALDLPNLDHMPITYLAPSRGAVSTSVGGHRLIQRLLNRGNEQATEAYDGVEKALRTLISTPSSRSVLPPTTFFDYQYARVAPWVTVTGKISDADPVKIEAHVEEGELRFTTTNIASLELDLSAEGGFPAEAESIRLNDRLISFHKGEKILHITESEVPYQWRKVDLPGGFANFFRNEPVYIIYQDKEAPDAYLRGVHAVATKLSKLELTGLPKLNLELPLLPLSQYDPSLMRHHRAILIGQHQVMQSTLSDAPEEYPLRWTEEELVVNQRIDRSLGVPMDGVTYGMIFPPTKHSSLKLAMVLSASDLDGVHVLDQYYTSATAIFDKEDLRLWAKGRGGYTLALEQLFDRFWGPPQPSLMVATLPQEPAEIWEHLMQELLLKEGKTSAMITPPIVDSAVRPPSRLTHHSLTRFIPNRNFAVVTLRGEEIAHAGNQLLDLLGGVSGAVGLDRISSFDESRRERRLDPEKIEGKTQLRMLVDTVLLSQLQGEVLANLNYDLLPYSLHEILLRKLDSQSEELSRELVQLANEFYH